MKQYKYTELLLNATFITGFILCFAITQSFEWLFLSYVVVGSVQLLSMLIHLWKGWFSNHMFRVGYYWFLLVLIAFCFTGFGIWFLLYASPLMAAFYVYICYREWKILKLKELVHLK
jgi:hypothetical protein